MRPIYFDRQLPAADDNGIALAQQLVGAGPLVLAGALVVAGVAQLGSQRRVELDSAGNLSAINFTITGYNDQGQAVSEVLAGPNAAPVVSVLDYSQIISITASAAVGTDIIAGTSEVGSSALVPLDIYLKPFQVTLGAVIAGTLDLTAEFTLDDIWNQAAPYTWYPVDGLTNAAATAADTLISPVMAVRFTTNSGDGSAACSVQQAGVIG